jgi:broad specificity phosphatase PhoE
MVLDLYLFRHYETVYNANNGVIIGGQSNALTSSPRGEIQAAALGERLNAEGILFDEVYCSTAVRAIGTAEIVCDIIGFPFDKVQKRESLLEISQGEWEGKKRDEIYTPEVLAQLREQHWDFKAPGGESQREVEIRVYNQIHKDLIEERDKENVRAAVFGHGLAIKCFLRRITNSDPKMTYRDSIDNCSITYVRYIPKGQHEGWSIVKVNDNAHLTKVGFVPLLWS